jgi:hypothetical protein
VLLFCLASGTQYARIRITHATVQQMIVRNFVERDAAGRLTLTDHRLAVLHSPAMFQEIFRLIGAAASRRHETAIGHAFKST